MTGSPPPAPPPQPLRALRRLRVRLWLWFALASALAIVAVVVVLLVFDTSHRRAEQDAELRGQAERASALMFGSATRPQTGAVGDDSVSEPPRRVVVFATGGSGPVGAYASTAAVDVPAESLLALVRAEADDEAETGSRAVVEGADGPLRAVAVPWFADDGAIGGVVVALGPRPGPGDGALLGPLAASVAVLWLVLLASAWGVTGRSLRPAVEAQRTRETFLATAAPELRTPLSRLRAGAEALARTAGPQDPRRAGLAELVTVADGASYVVDNLLLAASIDWGEPRSVRMPERLDLLVAALEHRDPAVVADVAAPVTAQVDVRLLRHALDNLVANALRHAAAGAAEPLVVVALTATADHARIEVTDNGGGFPPGHPARRGAAQGAFLPGAAGGTGLGLPLVGWIARRHGGTLVVADVGEPVTGARVVLEIPLAPPPAGSARP